MVASGRRPAERGPAQRLASAGPWVTGRYVDTNELLAARPFQRRSTRGNRLRARIWREWCFLKATIGHLGVRLGLMVAIVILGGISFKVFEPDRQHSLIRACYFTWALVFGESPEEFPDHLFLQSLFFIVPVLGLTVIIEGIVDLSMLVGDRRRSERRWCAIMAAAYKDHIVLVGFGKLGFRTYKLLHQLNESVVIIECNTGCQFLEEARREGAPVLIGDARRESLLADANVAHARSIILATDNDLANLEIALDARKINPSIRVVLRMFDQNMADKIREGFNIPMAMSQSAMSAPAFATAAIGAEIVNSFAVGDQLVVMQRWKIDAGGGLAGRTVGQIISQRGVGVVEHRPRGGAVKLFPPVETKIENGDELLVQGVFETLHEGATGRLQSP